MLEVDLFFFSLLIRNLEANREHYAISTCVFFHMMLVGIGVTSRCARCVGTLGSTYPVPLRVIFM